MEQKESTDFFQHHSLNYIEMAMSTDRMEQIRHPDGYGKKTGDCGDTVEFFLKGNERKIKSIAFMVNGCMNTVACSNTVARFAEGQSAEKAWEITPEQVAEFLETLPEDHYHCAELAVGTFYLALVDLTSGKPFHY
ncbi:MAG: iron-sulfur cluster assembly scaffold protein [Proteobacteria bacterium]|nr:iron-sulfur cluster assembly scaffold protein [Pseudomonadota bacterium]MBU1388083.1 iron-sulfur cluster assembly scaffold protein [Pseudomonadota bacterium]MBU1542147.1 iron-sulfur cluster assembly scaffold protein [Pseudomonadota bacterium]MBU2481166.1 iron-sulfur cluster assembly scaffold protein [Pseudomonadota bacterium]